MEMEAMVGTMLEMMLMLALMSALGAPAQAVGPPAEEADFRNLSIAPYFSYL